MRSGPDHPPSRIAPIARARRKTNIDAQAPCVARWCRSAQRIRGFAAAGCLSSAFAIALSSCLRGSSPLLHDKDLLGEMAHLARRLAVWRSLDHGEPPRGALSIDDALVEGGCEHGQVLKLRQRGCRFTPDSGVCDHAIDDECAFETLPELPGFPDQLDRLGRCPDVIG